MIDSDIFVQLAGVDALEDAVIALGLSWAQCRRMANLSGMLRGGCFDCSESAKLKALNACQYVPAIEERSGARDIKKLLLGEIDPGELLALAHLAEDHQALFMSGDLQWMRKINKPRFRTVRQLIAGRVLCLETVLAILVEYYGTAKVIERLGTDPRYITLKILFSKGIATTERDVIEGIRSYNHDRKREFGADFFYPGGPLPDRGTPGV